MVDLVAVFVVAVRGELCLPCIELLHQRLSGAHRESEVVAQCSDCFKRTILT